MYVYVIMKSSDVIDVADTLDTAMEVVDEDRYRNEGLVQNDHAWVPGTIKGNGRGPRLYWQAVVNGNESAGYGIFRWPVR
jgi:predicted deacylase